MKYQQSTVYLSLGANLGDRLLTLKKAIQALDELDDVGVNKASGVYETEPWGLKDQPPFLNIVVEIETVLAPLELLGTIKALEVQLGRLPGLRWGPREIDIDIILWDDLIMHTPELIVPHEHFRERHFVLAPLKEIAPNAVDPVAGDTVAVLLSSLAPVAMTRWTDVIYS